MVRSIRGVRFFRPCCDPLWFHNLIHPRTPGDPKVMFVAVDLEVESGGIWEWVCLVRYLAGAGLNPSLPPAEFLAEVAFPAVLRSAKNETEGAEVSPA